MVRAGHFPNTLEALDQSQHTDPADQSEHSVLFRRRGFIETGSKKSVTDRLGREEPQQWRIINNQAGKPALVEPETTSRL